MFSGPTLETVNLKMVHLRRCSIKLGAFKMVMGVKSVLHSFDPGQWKRATAGLGLAEPGLAGQGLYSPLSPAPLSNPPSPITSLPSPLSPSLSLPSPLITSLLLSPSHHLYVSPPHLSSPQEQGPGYL